MNGEMKQQRNGGGGFDNEAWHATHRRATLNGLEAAREAEAYNAALEARGVFDASKEWALHLASMDVAA